MGKKKNRGKSSLLNDSASFSTLDDGDSSHNSFNFSNVSIKDETAVPEKFIVSSVENAGCELYAKCLKSEWENVVFLHPFIMRAYNIEDLVMVQGKQNKTLCYAYPLKQIKKTFVVFPKTACGFKFEEIVSLQPYEGKLKDAEGIFISMCSEKTNIDQNVIKLISRLLCNKFVYEGLKLKWKLFDEEYECVVENIASSVDISNLSLNETSDCYAFYSVSHKTILKFEPQTVPKQHNTSAFACIGGLETQMKKINENIRMFLSAENCCLKFCKTLILQGPPGTGKSLLLNAISKEHNFYVQHIQWYRICGMSQAGAKRELLNAFETIVNRARSIIIIDEINHLCPSKNSSEIIQQFIKKTLKHLLQTLNGAKVMILAATNSSDYDESVLQIPGRLMEIIKFKIPSSSERLDILKKLLDSRTYILPSEQIEECAELAHGFTGKDLLNAVKDAQMLSCKREYFTASETTEVFKLRKKATNADTVKYLDLKLAVKLKKPTIVAASDLKVKKVQWTDIGGMTDVKEKLKQLVEWPLKYSEGFKTFSITPSRGVLMYGPPGCSKTMIAKALATECELNFISKNASDLYDKYVGESERAVRDLFTLAKAKSPCIIFLDEIDALVIERGSSSGASGVGDRIVTTLLTEMDGIEELHGVIIIAATNRPDMLDDALVRNGRINHFIYIPLPDVTTREEILRISMKNRTVSEEFDFKLLSKKTEGYSGAEIVNICNEAALQLLSEDPKGESVFSMHHFDVALKQVFPRTSKDMIEFYESFNEKHCTK